MRELEVPYRVVINEAVELAKVYGGTDGHKFVNGVLDKLAARLREIEVDAERGAANERWRADDPIASTSGCASGCSCSTSPPASTSSWRCGSSAVGASAGRGGTLRLIVLVFLGVRGAQLLHGAHAAEAVGRSSVRPAQSRDEVTSDAKRRDSDVASPRHRCMRSLMTEFELIRRFFTHRTPRRDRSASATMPRSCGSARGSELAVSADMLVEGRHFLAERRSRAARATRRSR